MALGVLMKINGREFTFLIASDIERDGIGVELNEQVNGKTVFIAEIFRNDSKKEIEFYSSKSEIPYAIILKLQEVFEAEIPKEYQD
jgi:hypothetical protein